MYQHIRQALVRTVLSVCLLITSSASADGPRIGPTEIQSSCEAVVVGGEQIFCFHQGVGSFSAQERARAVKERIERLLTDITFDPSALASVDRGDAVDVTAGDVLIMSLRDQDIVEVGASRQQVANKLVVRLREAFNQERKNRSPTEMLVGAGYSFVALLALISLLMIFGRVFPRIYTAIRNSEGKKIRSIRIQSFEVLTAERLVSALIWAIQVVRVLLTLFLLYTFVPLVLSFFPLTSTWAPRLISYVLEPLKMIGHVAVGFIPNLFFIATISLVTRYLLKVVRFFFSEIERGSIRFEGFYREWADPSYKLIRVLILAFALVMAFPYLPGSSSPAFQGISVFLGVLLSLGSSSAIANMVSGVVITYMRPFKVGDRVKITDTIGDVIEKNLLVTRVRSIKNVEITIPNSMVLGSHIVNYSSVAQTSGLILNTTVTIGYDVPWRQVHDLLREAATRTNMILKKPEPFVLQTALSDFYVAYELNAYTDQPAKMALIYSLLHANIQDAFNEAGVEIMSPHYSTLRDGNETTIPAEHRQPGYEVPSFRLRSQAVSDRTEPQITPVVSGDSVS